ncbi:hypothetical protein SLS60_006393 [Paraconiothyrium brasiliense]|uniref:C2H2-type domain-containing protein n=1 Tax=Paraconiothyrium brasiliense TaxID=300254 RepID=A0ABR3RAM3_9PLEO
MEAVTWSEVSYRQAPLPKLRIAQECPRRDSLSSSRTQDSGYISDPEISLSPLDFVSPHALFDVKEVALSRTKRLAVTTLNPIQAKKHKANQEFASIPKIEVTSNPKLVEPSVDVPRDHCTAGLKHLAEESSLNESIETWVKDNLRPDDRTKERNLSIVSLDSTGSCDMYSNTDDNSDDEHGNNTVTSPLPKATLKTIELIMRKIEVNLGYAAYMQCAGGHTSRTQGGANVVRGSRSSQASSGKRKARLDESLPPDDPDEDDTKRRRVSVATTTEDSETGPRFACPFFKHDPNRYRHKRTCGGPGWPTVHRMKEHLYRSHAQPIFCFRCYAMFDSDAELSGHLRGNPCQISTPQPIDGIDRRTFESLKKRSPALRLEEDKWRDAYQLLFPDVAVADIPSPYYDSDSPTEESRRFRRELLERVRQELFATAEREPGPVEQRLLRQVAGIIRRCESDLLESFCAPPGAHPSPPPPSRRTSEIMNPIDLIDNGATQRLPQHRSSFDHSLEPPTADPVPPTAPVSPRDVHDPGAPPPIGEWPNLDPFYPSPWIDWNIAFPPGPDIQGAEREDAFMTLSAPVWTQAKTILGMHKIIPFDRYELPKLATSDHKINIFKFGKNEDGLKVKELVAESVTLQQVYDNYIEPGKLLRLANNVPKDHAPADHVRLEERQTAQKFKDYVIFDAYSTPGVKVKVDTKKSLKARGNHEEIVSLQALREIKLLLHTPMEHFAVMLDKAYQFIALGSPVEFDMVIRHHTKKVAARIASPGKDTLDYVYRHFPHLRPDFILKSMPPKTRFIVHPVSDGRHVQFVIGHESIDDTLGKTDLTKRLFKVKQEVMKGVVEGRRIQLPKGARSQIIEQAYKENQRQGVAEEDQGYEQTGGENNRAGTEERKGG